VVGLNFIFYAFAKDFLRVFYNPSFSIIAPMLKVLAFAIRVARPIGEGCGQNYLDPPKLGDTAGLIGRRASLN
jgi:hypothetical protein